MAPLQTIEWTLALALGAVAMKVFKYVLLGILIAAAVGFVVLWYLLENACFICF